MVFLIPPKFSSCGIGTIQHFYSLIDVFRISRIFICRERQTTGTDCYIHTIIGVFILHGRQQLRVARTTMFRPCFQPQREYCNPFLSNDTLQVPFEILRSRFLGNRNGTYRRMAILNISPVHRVHIVYRLFRRILHILVRSGGSATLFE